MRLVISIVLLILLLLPTGAPAQELRVHRTFFTAWKYTVDGETYHKVGTQAEDLRLMMADYRACISALNSYRSHMTAAKVTGAVSVFLFGYIIVGTIRGGEWADGYTPAAIVGLSVGLGSVALEASGSRSLKRAARLYNQYSGFQSQSQPMLDPGVRLSLRFGL